MEISLNSEGDKKFQYINYFMHRVNLLKYHKITPVVVLDGGNIPCKAATENERYRQVSEVSYAFRIFFFMCPVDNLMRIMWVFDGEYCKCLFRRRKANKEMAMEKLKEGNVNAATELFQVATSMFISKFASCGILSELMMNWVEFSFFFLGGWVNFTHTYYLRRIKPGFLFRNPSFYD